MLVFIGIWIWAWLPHHRATFDALARLPMTDDAEPAAGDEERPAMSDFWSAWVIVLATVNLGIALFLFVWGQRDRFPTQPDGTTGHVWAHGVLREGVRRLPTLVGGVLGRVSLSAALLLSRAVPGLRQLPGHARLDLHRRSCSAKPRPTPCGSMRRSRAIRGVPVEQLARDRGACASVSASLPGQLRRLPRRDGARQPAWARRISMDADWLYGGDAEAILTSILDGRKGVMPALGGVLGHKGANEVAAYVAEPQRHQAPADWIAAGKVALRSPVRRLSRRRRPRQPGARRAEPDRRRLALRSRLRSHDAKRSATAATAYMPAWRERLGEDRARAIAAWVVCAGQRETGAAD